MSSRRHPLRVLFNSDADELGTHCMHQCFISSSSYSEVKTELSFENYGPRRKTPGLGVDLMWGWIFLMRGLQTRKKAQRKKKNATRTQRNAWYPTHCKSECDFFTILLSFREILDIHNDHEIHHHSLPRVRHLGHGFGRQKQSRPKQQTEESHQVIL